MVGPRVCVVTGASDGIGFETAKGLAARGDRVALLCRTAERAEATRARLAAAQPGAHLDAFAGDLACQAEVRRLAGEISDRYQTLAVLVNNAGLVCSARALSPDGVERQLAVNYLAPYLLTRLLLPRLRAAGRARIVNVVSGAHARARLDPDDLDFARRRYSGLAAYGQSKLALVLFSLELARRLRGSDVSVNCASPGMVRTRIGSKHTVLRHRLLHELMSLAGTSPERGARTSLWLATAPELEGASGGLYSGRRRVSPARAARDEALARRLWEISAARTGLPADETA